MNYCIAAFAIIVLISTFQWIIDGRKNFHGPQLDVDALKHGEVEGMAVGSHEENAEDSVGKKSVGSGSMME